MRRLSLVFALVAFLLLAAGIQAADETLATASGKVEKKGKDSVTIQTRRPDGTFGKTLTLRITGTSDFSSILLRGKKGTVVQRKAKEKDLKKNATVAVIYANTKEGSILLSAVIQPGGK